MNNVINKFFLWLVLLPIKLYGRLGVNTVQLKAILTTKLIMDDRRPNTFQQTKRIKKKTISLATLFTMFMSAVLGCMFLFAFSVGGSYTFQLTFYFSMYIVLLASSLISDFTSVLIDIRDNYIILPKPVNDRTIVVGRLLHILIHICKLVLPMSLPAVIYMAINTTVAGTIAFFLLIILATLFTVFLINALYILILKITTPQKFQNIISSFQIVFAIVMYGSYQFVPRVIQRLQLENYNFSAIGNWVWFAPSYWFAKAWPLLAKGTFTNNGLLATAIALVVPLASIYVVIKYFAPSFNQKLSLINNSNPEGSGEENIKSIKPANEKNDFVSKLSKWLCKPGAERMAFLFTWKMTGRSRDFKMKVYPSIGYLAVMIALMFFQSGRGLNSLSHDGEKLPYIFTGVIYFSNFVLLMAIGQLQFSDKYKAAWIYYSTPVAHPGHYLNGALKAIIVKFYLPIALLAFIIAMAFVGPSILPNMVLGFFNEMFICSIFIYITMRKLPFASQQNNNVKGGSFFRGIFSLAIFGVVAVLHFFISKL